LPPEEFGQVWRDSEMPGVPAPWEVEGTEPSWSLLREYFIWADRIDHVPCFPQTLYTGKDREASENLVEQSHNGRELRFDRNSRKFLVQPANDNYWAACDTLEDARLAFDDPASFRTVFR
jgi:hypothetical protein